MLKSEIFVSAARRNVLVGVVVFLFVILVGKLYYLQIYQFEKYRELADFNRIRLITTYAPRGKILDRHGKVLAANRSVYTISVIPDEVANRQELDLIADYLGSKGEEIESSLKKYSRGPFLPARVAREIPVERLGYIEEHRAQLPGVMYSEFPIRLYPQQVRANASHVLGYLREISHDDLRQPGHNGYSPGDFVGFQGIEKQYESRLKGSKGIQYQQVDALGREVGLVMDRDAIPAAPGQDLKLTIDAPLQAYVERLLEGKTGVAVVLDAFTGEVLVLVSKPDYPLEDFAGFMKGDEWRKYLADERKPLLNRAVLGRYPPGSAIKLIAVVAALENGLVDANWTVKCTGSYPFGDRVFGCWKTEGHGWVNLSRAVVESCNVYFYHLIQRIGLDLWYQYARLFGFGEKTGIDLPEELPGLIPSRSFMDKKYGKGGWTQGNLLNMVIGQGDVLVTPIQMARFIALVATRGRRVVPWLVSRPESISTEEEQRVNLKEFTWDSLYAMTFDVVNDENGTAFSGRVADPAVKFYGKTGTAENPHGDPHAWFIGFAAKGAETIALAVLVENGGTGGSAAAPLAGQIVTRHFETQPETVAKR